MVSWFSENPLSSSEDLMWMPDVPFRYYLYSFISAVTAYGQYPSQHDNFDNASAAADCFMAMIIWRLKEQPESIIPVFEDVYKVAEYIAAHQDGFDADPDIYGSFVDRLRRIKSLYDNLQR